MTTEHAQKPSQVTGEKIKPKPKPAASLVIWRAFVARLRARREALGMTQEDLSVSIAKGVRSIQRWENYEVAPSGIEVFLWCSALGWEVGDALSPDAQGQQPASAGGAS